MADIGIIGGTGFAELAQGQVIEETMTPYGEISSPVVISQLSGKSVAFLARHGNPHIIPPHKVNYRANLWVLKQQGVSAILAVNAVGGIPAEMGAGALVLPDQLLDYTYGREHTYYDGSSAELEHVDFSYPYSDKLRSAINQAASECSMALIDKAVYAAVQGPRLETAAEINRIEKDGGDIVGMTAMPEAGLARELGLHYAGICLVVNPAAGRSKSLITMEEIHAVVDEGMGRIKALLASSVALL